VAASFSQWADLIKGLAWPAAVFGIFVLLVATRTGKRFLIGLSGSVRRVKAGGIEIELKAETAAENKANLEEVFADYRRAVNSEFDRLVRAHHVKSLHDRLAENIITPKVQRGVRSTVYVADILFASALYRLVGYYPRGGGRGLVYSIRYGIIGKTWRLEGNQHELVPTDQEQLVSLWGMTKPEALHAVRDSARQGFACIIIESGDALVGLIYIDHKTSDGFSLSESACREIESSQEFKALASAVGKVTSEIAGRGPQLAIFGED
jgi:hypothetical protein